MADTDELVAELSDRVARHPPERYQVQHATARFHLGSLLLELGRLEEAEEALAHAVRWFDPERLPVEHATAMNALGAVLRADGRPALAVEAFEHAVARFAAAGQSSRWRPPC